MDTSDAWAQLVSTTDTESEAILVRNDTFVLGRSDDCDYSFAGNALISARHCSIVRDTDSGTTWLSDTSTNGTLINKKQKVKKQKVAIKHGDEIHLIFRKDDSAADVAFLFQDLEELKKEIMSDTSDDQINIVNQTLAYETSVKEDENFTEPLNTKVNKEVKKAVKPPLKRLLNTEVDASPADEKKLKQDCETLPITEQTVDLSLDTICSESNICGRDTQEVAEDSDQIADSSKTSVKGKNLPEKSTRQLRNRGKVSDASKQDSSDIGGVSEKSVAISDDSVGHDKGNVKCEADKQSVAETKVIDPTESSATCVPGTSNSNNPTSKVSEGEEATTSKASVAEEDEVDAIEESLLCIICQEILYKCISVQPCMHTFCSSCYSDWMELSKECPSCRTKVKRINKNHIVNNLVDAYLAAHPDKQRSAEDLRQLDAKNKITKEMLELPKRRNVRINLGDDDDVDDDEDDDSEGENYSDEDDDDEYYNNPAYPAVNAYNQNAAWGFNMNYAAAYQPRPPPPTVCRQCPGNAGFGAVTVAAAAAAVGAAAVGGATNNAGAADGFVCTAYQIHILCQCCNLPMPLRHGTTGRPQKCDVCSGSYCHAYWGCRGLGCMGCLAHFEDLKFGREFLTGLVLENQFESEILSNYLQAENITVDEFVKECTNRLAAQNYHCTNEVDLLDRTKYVCYKCARKNLSDLAYQYRRDIPVDKLTAVATSRTDCYWGKNCRTQRNKPAHAIKFNHICEQTRNH